MSRIKGRFAPLTEELGNDSRFLLELTDFQKLLFILVIYTTHMTHHKAPSKPVYYQKRYGLKAPASAIKKGLRRVLEVFKDAVRIQLEDGKETLSMVNSTTYKHQIRLEAEADKETEPDTRKTKVKNVENGLFFDFWKLYPRCLAFKKSQGVFEKLKVTPAMWEDMKKVIVKSKGSPQWRKEEGKYIPASYKWLEEERWRDSVHEQSEPKHIRHIA